MMHDDPIRLRDDPDAPACMRALLGAGRAAPPPMDPAARRASSLLAAKLAAGSGAPWLWGAGAKLGAKLLAAVLIAGVGAGAITLAWPDAPQRTIPPPQRVERASTALPMNDSEPEPTVAVLEEETVVAPVRRVRRAPEAVPSESDLAAEAALLENARRALDSDPAEALRATDRHRREHPRGALAPERELIAVVALTRLSRREAAERRANAWIAHHPDGIYAERFRRVLER